MACVCGPSTTKSGVPVTVTGTGVAQFVVVKVIELGAAVAWGPSVIVTDTEVVGWLASAIDDQHAGGVVVGDPRGDIVRVEGVVGQVKGARGVRHDGAGVRRSLVDLVVDDRDG